MPSTRRSSTAPLLAHESAPATGLAPVTAAVSLVEKRETQLPAAAAPDDWVLMFERLATNPQVDVDKLDKLIGMRERLLKADAKAQFDASFAAMQGELPVITEHGAIEVDGEVRSRYARYEDIIEIIRPVLTAHGFALRHRNESLSENGKTKLRIIGVLSHRAGHSEEDVFECPPDASGRMGDIQRIGSTRSYGMRYTTLALLNIVTRGQDDDGNRATEKERPTTPEGYDDWSQHLSAQAEKGSRALFDTWNKSNPVYRQYVTKHERAKWESLKAQAAKVS